MKLLVLAWLISISYHGNEIEVKRSTEPFFSVYSICQPQDYKALLPSTLFTTYVQNTEKTVNFKYNTLVELLVKLLICIALLVVVLTPLVLIFFWVHYSIQYVKKYRDIFGIKKWLQGRSNLNYESYPGNVWRQYRIDYSKMIGFGLSFLAYTLSSNIYMFRNFNRIDTALSEYFGFPFEVLESMGWLGTVREQDGTLMEVWKEMLSIVGVSVAMFFIGYLIGSIIVNWRYSILKKRNKRHI